MGISAMGVAGGFTRRGSQVKATDEEAERRQVLFETSIQLPRILDAINAESKEKDLLRVHYAALRPYVMGDPQLMTSYMQLGSTEISKRLQRIHDSEARTETALTNLKAQQAAGILPENYVLQEGDIPSFDALWEDIRGKPGDFPDVGTTDSSRRNAILAGFGQSLPEVVTGTALKKAAHIAGLPNSDWAQAYLTGNWTTNLDAKGAPITYATDPVAAMEYRAAEALATQAEWLNKGRILDITDWSAEDKMLYFGLGADATTAQLSPHMWGQIVDIRGKAAQTALDQAQADHFAEKTRLLMPEIWKAHFNRHKNAAPQRQRFIENKVMGLFETGAVFVPATQNWIWEDQQGNTIPLRYLVTNTINLLTREYNEAALAGLYNEQGLPPPTEMTIETWLDPLKIGIALIKTAAEMDAEQTAGQYRRDESSTNQKLYWNYILGTAEGQARWQVSAVGARQNPEKIYNDQYVVALQSFNEINPVIREQANLQVYNPTAWQFQPDELTAIWTNEDNLDRSQSWVTLNPEGMTAVITKVDQAIMSYFAKLEPDKTVQWLREQTERAKRASVQDTNITVLGALNKLKENNSPENQQILLTVLDTMFSLVPNAPAPAKIERESEPVSIDAEGRANLLDAFDIESTNDREDIAALQGVLFDENGTLNPALAREILKAGGATPAVGTNQEALNVSAALGILKSWGITRPIKAEPPGY